MMSKHRRKEKDHGSHGPMMSKAVHRKMLLMLSEPGSSTLLPCH
jgi:hypothetical protein